jgi:hypothetical protein
MLRSERDYIMRMIALAAIMVARLREKLAAGAKPVEVVEEARAAQGQLLGKDLAIYRALDGASAAQLIGDRETVRAWADLLELEADALRMDGQDAEADRMDAIVSALRA